MNFKQLNEAFRNQYGEIKYTSKPLTESFQTALKDALSNKAQELIMQGTVNIKAYEIAFQDVIENLEPDKLWWEVTDLNIFYDLFENRDVMGCVDRIIGNLKPQYKDTTPDNSNLKY